MVWFKVTDIRVNRKADGKLRAYINGFGTGYAFAGELERVGIMLSVFRMKRDCYFDDATKTFSTIPYAWNQGPSQLNQGQVASWEMRVSETAGERPQFFVTLLGDTPKPPPTSGTAALGWAKIEVTQREAPLVLGLLTSPYCYYAAGALRNTEITQDIG